MRFPRVPLRIFPFVGALGLPEGIHRDFKRVLYSTAHQAFVFPAVFTTVGIDSSVIREGVLFLSFFTSATVALAFGALVVANAVAAGSSDGAAECF